MPPAMRTAKGDGERRRLQGILFGVAARRASGRGAAATSSTSAWLTRLDLPEPETPVTEVKTPSGKRASRSWRLLRVTPASRSHPVGARRRGADGRTAGGVEVEAGLRGLDVAEPGGRTAVEDLAAVFAGSGADVDDPVGAADDIELMLDDEKRIARRLRSASRARSRASVSAGWRPAEGSSSTYTTPKRLERICVARRRRCSSPGERVGVLRSSGEIAEAEVEERVEPRDDVLCDAAGDGGFLGVARSGRGLRPSA